MSEYPSHDDENFMRISHGVRLEKLLLAVLGNQATIMTALARATEGKGRKELADKATDIIVLLNEMYPSGRLQ